MNFDNSFLKSLAYASSISFFLLFPFYYTSVMDSANLLTLEGYKRLYKESAYNADSFWSKVASDLIYWNEPFHHVSKESFDDQTSAWFKGGKLNACYNCVDRHALVSPEKPALIWTSDSTSDGDMIISFYQLQKNVSKLSNWLQSVAKVKKGDTVTIYMPMIPEAIYAMLACARIGAIHNVVFGGFSSSSLRDRFLDSSSKLLICADYGYRGGKAIDMMSNVISATQNIDVEHRVLMYYRNEASRKFSNWHTWDEVAMMSDVHLPEAVDSESPLFMLYTSGSTGKPKGLVHGTGGYLVYVSFTSKLVFDLQDNDKMATIADIGWITGHSYLVYGPLSNGITTLIFEGMPNFPEPDGLWNLVQKYKFTQLYTAPTVIRMLKKYGKQPFEGKDLSSLKVIGTVGEPINSDAWLWYKENVGNNTAAVVDTYWQTETGGHVITPIPHIMNPKPGSATSPFLGVLPAVLNPENGKELELNDVQGVLCFKKPWPGMALSIWKDHSRYIETYLTPFPGYFYSGDRVYRDSDGHYWIQGRADDVINTAAHRLSTAEIEDAACKAFMISEAAALGRPDEIIGESIWVFCVLKNGYEHMSSMEIERQVTISIRNVIGPIATPRKIVIVSDLPKTRSGKILRRLLRKLLCGYSSDLGDTSTLSNPLVLDEIRDKIKKITD